MDTAGEIVSADWEPWNTLASVCFSFTWPFTFEIYIKKKGTLNQFFFYAEICFWKVTKFSIFFWKWIYR